MKESENALEVGVLCDLFSHNQLHGAPFGWDALPKFSMPHVVLKSDSEGHHGSTGSDLNRSTLGQWQTVQDPRARALACGCMVIVRGGGFAAVKILFRAAPCATAPHLKALM
jgi:hypothetical protein